jgi:hypothetical protein
LKPPNNTSQATEAEEKKNVKKHKQEQGNACGVRQQFSATKRIGGCALCVSV